MIFDYEEWKRRSDAGELSWFEAIGYVIIEILCFFGI